MSHEIVEISGIPLPSPKNHLYIEKKYVATLQAPTIKSGLTERFFAC